MALVCCQRAETEKPPGERFFMKGTQAMEHTRQEPQTPEQNEKINRMVRLAQTGDEDAFATLFRSYAPLVDHLVEKYAAAGVPEADLRSDAIDAFSAAVTHFDPDRGGVTFGLYARICIGNRLISALRAYRRIRSTVSLEGIDPDALRAGDESDPSHYILEAERYADLCRKMEAVLSPAEREIWMLFISGMTAGQIAAQLKTNRKSVENALFRARKKLRESFSDR